MENIIIFKGILKTKKYVVVKEIENFNNFKEVITVFQDYPYNEILTEEDIKAEYESYIDNGHMFGCFVEDEIAGINCILNEVPDDYSIGFEDESKIAYYSGLAVKKDFRKLGLGKILVSQTEKHLEETGQYESAFARILCEGSMSERIFKENGFEDAYYNNELIIDKVDYMRNDGERRSDNRKYMVKRISGQNNYYRR